MPQMESIYWQTVLPWAGCELTCYAIRILGECNPRDDKHIPNINFSVFPNIPMYSDSHMLGIGRTYRAIISRLVDEMELCKVGKD